MFTASQLWYSHCHSCTPLPFDHPPASTTPSCYLCWTRSKARAKVRPHSVKLLPVHMADLGLLGFLLNFLFFLLETLQFQRCCSSKLSIDRTIKEMTPNPIMIVLIPRDYISLAWKCKPSNMPFFSFDRQFLHLIKINKKSVIS